jgi:murein DD-endopeptidase MepM/ murein hydrolase activator NlpD
MKIAFLSMFTIASLAPIQVGSTTELNAGWQVPFDSPHRLVRQYIQPASDYSSGHRGVDFEVEPGEPLFAPADGVISVSRLIVNRGVLAMKHGAGLVSELEPACSELAVGDIVRKGDKIGWVCPASETYVQHCQDDLCIHFSLRFEGKYLSPLALIGGLNPSRLLPYARG